MLNDTCRFGVGEFVSVQETEYTTLIDIGISYSQKGFHKKDEQIFFCLQMVSVCMAILISLFLSDELSIRFLKQS